MKKLQEFYNAKKQALIDMKRQGLNPRQIEAEDILEEIPEFQAKQKKNFDSNIISVVEIQTFRKQQNN